MWVHGADIVWRYFDIGASFIWAVSGALLAARRGYDLTGTARWRWSPPREVACFATASSCSRGRRRCC